MDRRNLADEKQKQQLLAIGGQPSAKSENQIQHPHLPRFPAYGVFLLKRPKGTKSRRWARGLPYAQRESRRRRTGYSALLTSQVLQSSALDGIARSALLVLWKGVLIVNFIEFLTSEEQSVVDRHPILVSNTAA